MAKAQSFESWAKGAPKQQVKCETCRKFPELAKDIAKYVRLRDAGKIGVGLKAFRNSYLAPRGYMLSWRSLENHIAGCLRGRR